ncbi:flagellar motor protein [Dactylosporangium matsuzakiense]|uniref:Motility protein A n=1 Tax=Dactylosporangium matsuzakiense TaxID=53360 RepID=A0A9W6NSX8_9ACTN|nr:flagellar motor protein [Dactylosporangium matsuzakiense]UWZ43814.1 flagellar motor protein [Dactylosporangium matsuzakiense]GLL07933.1 motility protein A [Dactylosporangium matsuzakiense]
MDPATIAGIVLAFIAIFAAMILEGGSPGSIFLVPPLVLVFVGTLGAAMAGGMLKDTIALIDSFKRVLLSKSATYDTLVEDIVKLAEKARREGLLALEDAMKEVQDPFLKKGLQLAIDGTDSEELAAILEAEVDAKKKADKQAAAIFTAMGGYAPTIGIIGTVIGLIHVLENLSQPEKLGHLIAGAFVATLWGVLSANVMWLPMGAKLKRLSEIECAQMELVIAGIINIQAGANPRLVAQKLRSLLPPGTVKEEKKAA